VSFRQKFTFSLKHQSSNLNKVVDALGIRVTMLNNWHANWVSFRQEFTNDMYKCARI
jgi:hypothetical protein